MLYTSYYTYLHILLYINSLLFWVHPTHVRAHYIILEE